MGAPAFEIPNFLVGVWPANSDLSSETTGQYHCVLLTAATGSTTGYAGAALALASTGQPILGVLQNNPASNEAGTVMLQGISKAYIGTGGCTLGGLLMADANGAFVAATSGNYASAMAMATANAGDVTSVLLKSFGKV